MIHIWLNEYKIIKTTLATVRTFVHTYVATLLNENSTVNSLINVYLCGEQVLL